MEWRALFLQLLVCAMGLRAPVGVLLALGTPSVMPTDWSCSCGSLGVKELSRLGLRRAGLAVLTERTAGVVRLGKVLPRRG